MAESFSRYYFQGVMFRAALVGGAMLCSFAGGALAGLTGSDWAGFAGACAGLVIGVVLALVVLRRWDPLDRDPS